MKKIFVVFMFFCVVSCSWLIGEPEDLVAKNGWILRYDENFDFLSESDWAKAETGELHPRRGGWWDPDQLLIKDGNLIIRTSYFSEEEAKVKGKNSEGYYTSCVTWKKKAKFGYYEAKCKFPNIRGQWVAFWLMSETITEKGNGCRDGSEIDICESAMIDSIDTTIHWDNWTARKTKRRKVKELYNNYHTYALDWTPDYQRFYIDNILAWEVDDYNLVNQTLAKVYFSTEVNGSVVNGKPLPSGAFWPGVGDIKNILNKLPADFCIDYFRIYDNGYLVIKE